MSTLNVVRIWWASWHASMLQTHAMCEMVRIHDPFQSLARTPHDEIIRALWDTDLDSVHIKALCEARLTAFEAGQ